MGQKIYRSADGENIIAKKYGELLRHWPVEKQQHQIDTPHGQTHVIVSGNPASPPLILLHGACDNSLMWLKQVTHYIGRYQIFAVDIPGEPNLSAKQRLPMKGDFHREWFESILSYFQLKQVTLVGFDLGANICLQFIRHWPDRIEKLALLSPSGVVSVKKRLKIKTALLSILSGPFGRRWLLRGLLRRNLDPNQSDLNDAIIHHFKPRSWSLPKVVKQPLPAVYCPVLLMLGGRDQIYSSNKVLIALANRFPQIELILRTQENHYLNDYSRELERFLVTEFSPD